jgi:hypothetical protein
VERSLDDGQPDDGTESYRNNDANVIDAVASNGIMAV